MGEPAERRQVIRCPVALPVRIVRGEWSLDVKTVNLSLGGMAASVEPELEFALGERVQVSIRVPVLPGPLQARAVVRWRSPDNAIVGFQFASGFRPHETLALSRYLSTVT
jgi:c-di-GMP-binding flagellar brake protein YcgR